MKTSLDFTRKELYDLVWARPRSETTKLNTMTMRVSDELKQKLDHYAKLTGRSMSYVATTAVDEYLAWRIPQLEDLEEAIKAADAGDFASPEEVAAVFSKHGS